MATKGYVNASGKFGADVLPAAVVKGAVVVVSLEGGQDFGGGSEEAAVMGEVLTVIDTCFDEVAAVFVIVRVSRAVCT